MKTCPFCDENLCISGDYAQCNKCAACRLGKDKDYYFYYNTFSSNNIFSIEFKNHPFDYIENADKLCFTINNQFFNFPKVKRTKENVINALEQYYRLKRLMSFS
jgi:hypothetical protein